MPNQTVIFSVAVDPAEVAPDDVEGLLLALTDFSPVLFQMGIAIGQDEARNFQEEGALAGTPWPAPSPRTVAEKRRHGYPDQQLVRTGHLWQELGNTILVDNAGDSVTAGIDTTMVPYARYHDEGDGVPQRVIIAVFQEMIDDLMATIQNYFIQRIGHFPRGLTIALEAA